MRKLTRLKAKFPPKWKVKRELRRIRDRHFNIPALLERTGIQTLYYDRVQSRKIRITIGKIQLKDKAAIYLVFPKDGILPSHVAMIKSIISDDYAPVVVSNVQLMPKDREILKQISWKVIERPNIGYDFGGYRDAVLNLSKHLEHLKRLVILNDSIWYAPPKNDSWIRHAENCGTDLVGAVTNYGTPPPEKTDLLTFQWVYDRKRPALHYCSFALSLGPAILRDKEFYAFWQKYRLTSDKFRTVAQGEIGFSRFLIERGFSHQDTFGLAEFGDTIAALDREALERVLLELSFPDSEIFHRHFENLMQVDARERTLSWDEHARSLIMSAVAWHGAAYSIPGFNIQTPRFPFMKKSLFTFHEDACDAALRVVNRVGHNWDFDIKSEVETIYNPIISKQKKLAQKLEP